MTQEELREAPHLEMVDGSEITAEIDLSAIGLDGLARPVLVSDDTGMELSLTVADAKRLYEFLSNAVIYFEGKMQ
jgi:hypothetical protein